MNTDVNFVSKILKSEGGGRVPLTETIFAPYNLVACALQEIGEPFARAGLSGPAFRDMTRVAASDPGVAGAYCRANAEEVEAAWSELRAALERRLGELEAS